MKRVLSFILALTMTLTLCACGSPASSEENTQETTPETTEKTEEEIVTEKVNVICSIWYVGSTIGGNELKSSSGTITSLEKESDTEYIAHGILKVTDVYGTVYTNTIDCSVTSSDGGETWKSRALDFKSETFKRA